MGANLKRIIICDCEATCWETKEEQGNRPNEVIEIGICQLNMSTGAIEHGESYVVQPEFTSISPFCEKLTGWSQAAINEQGTTIQQALELIAEDFKLTKYDCWASCGEYDRVKLSSDDAPGTLLSLYGIKREQNPIASMRAHMNIKTMFAYKHRLKKEMGMARMLEKIKEPLDGRHHNGKDDAMNIAKIVHHVFS